MKPKAFVVLFTATTVMALPTETKHDAAFAAAPVVSQPAHLPEFVSLLSLGPFLGAAETAASVSPGVRQAAEALSDKFAATSAGESRIVHPSPAFRSALGSAIDPKLHTQVVTSAESNASNVPDPAKPNASEVASIHVAAAEKQPPQRSAKVQAEPRHKRARKSARAHTSKRHVAVAGHRHRGHRQQLAAARTAPPMHLAPPSDGPQIGFINRILNPALWN